MSEQVNFFLNDLINNPNNYQDLLTSKGELYYEGMDYELFGYEEEEELINDIEFLVECFYQDKIKLYKYDEIEIQRLEKLRKTFDKDVRYNAEKQIRRIARITKEEEAKNLIKLQEEDKVKKEKEKEKIDNDKKILQQELQRIKDKEEAHKKANFCKNCNKQFKNLSLHLAKSSKCN